MTPLFGTVTTPAERNHALASIKAAGDLGRELADLAALMFGAAALSPDDSHPQTHMQQGFARPARANDSYPLRLESFGNGHSEFCNADNVLRDILATNRPKRPLRFLFDYHLAISLPDLFADWHGMQNEDRDYLQRVAAMVFDRRLAFHANGPARMGGAA